MVSGLMEGVVAMGEQNGGPGEIREGWWPFNLERE
jgi:hypothetical protein